MLTSHLAMPCSNTLSQLSNLVYHCPFGQRYPHILGTETICKEKAFSDECYILREKLCPRAYACYIFSIQSAKMHSLYFTDEVPDQPMAKKLFTIVTVLQSKSFKLSRA